jgi:SNF2 family DNA or RNA helicase
MELYPFQAEDVAKLSRKRSALIGSEMGTGKTHEAIAIDDNWWKRYARKNNTTSVPPTLIVAPLNTHDSWQEKYAMQAPDTDVVTIDRKNRDQFVKDMWQKKGDVYLLHWDALRLMPDLGKFQFNTVIADEVHHAANRKAQQTRALKKIKTNFKLGLSGTASGDKPQNLWSVLHWLWPSYYTSYWNFLKYYTVQEMQHGGYSKIVGVNEAHLPVLYDQMAPWYVRHLKREKCCDHHPNGVMEWLPDKTYDTVWVDLSPQQRRVYNQMKEHMVAWVGEHEETALTATVVIAQMTRLSQIALATPYIETVQKRKRDPKTGELKPITVDVVKLELPSSKIDALKSIIEEHPEKQFVVMSSSKKACYLAQQALREAKITAEVLSGDTPPKLKEGLKERFRNKDFQVWIGVIAAAAEGIDYLQECTDTIIFLDREWSAFKNKQAEDRLHRGGQKDTVQVIDIMARHTVDLGRRQKFEAKWEWIRKILGDFDNLKEVA